MHLNFVRWSKFFFTNFIFLIDWKSLGFTHSIVFALFSYSLCYFCYFSLISKVSVKSIKTVSKSQKMCHKKWIIRGERDIQESVLLEQLSKNKRMRERSPWRTPYSKWLWFLYCLDTKKSEMSSRRRMTSFNGGGGL